MGTPKPFTGRPVSAPVPPVEFSPEGQSWRWRARILGGSAIVLATCGGTVLGHMVSPVWLRVLTGGGLILASSLLMAAALSAVDVASLKDRVHDARQFRRFVTETFAASSHPTMS